MSTAPPMPRLPIAEHLKLDFQSACVEYGIEDTPANFRIFCAGAAVSSVTFNVYAGNTHMWPTGADSVGAAIEQYSDAADTTAVHRSD